MSFNPFALTSLIVDVLITSKVGVVANETTVGSSIVAETTVLPSGSIEVIVAIFDTKPLSTSDWVMV